jgi:hypothetical protein
MEIQTRYVENNNMLTQLLKIENFKVANFSLLTIYNILFNSSRTSPLTRKEFQAILNCVRDNG